MFDHEDVKHSTKQEQGRPYVYQIAQKSCVLTLTKIDEDKTKTRRLVKEEEHDIEFREQGLSHPVKHLMPNCDRTASTTHLAKKGDDS